MATQEEIQLRRKSLEELIYSKGNGKLKIDDIIEFYNNEYGKDYYSLPTIRRDLITIGAKSNFKCRNTYSFKNYEDIMRLRENISSLFENFTMYKPLTIDSTINTSTFMKEDVNPEVSLNYVLVKSTSTSYESSISNLVENLRNLYDMKNESLDSMCFEILIANSYVKFIFDDITTLTAFYLNLYTLKYRKDLKDISLNKESNN
ncbi:hypothetical protein JY742_18465 [Clostridioides difficile]|nr:hypothetical protein [Clostridioides difficile]